MHPTLHARATPDKPAYVMAESGAALTYRALDEASNRFAHLLRRRGIQSGDHIALLLENRLDFFTICWGAQRSGIIFTAISTHLKAEEVAYILANSGSKLFVTSRAHAGLAAELLPTIRDTVPHRLMLDDPTAGYDDFAAELAAQPTNPIADEHRGGDMLYSSGTTGRPKGVFVPPASDDIAWVDALTGLCAKYFGMGTNTVYLSPAPLYHAAPLRFCMVVARLGGTCVVMPRFDAERYMALVERHRATHTQLVPTMFVRMLKLAPEVRARHDLRSLRFAIHAAAPCPVPIKQQMIAWWGPIIWEYYAGTEGNGLTLVDSKQWLAHPGTVGQAAVGVLHICGPDGEELPAGRTGIIYFGGGNDFAYHGDAQKTAESHLPNGWSTLGDIGHVDAEGYLYLTDRRAYMIISGGVNIYPQEIEDLLITHPQVLDAAVFGIPNDEFGEEVKAVVQLRSRTDRSDATARALLEFCRAHLSAIKCPRSIDFMDELPRHATGKLYKRLLRDPYWAGHEMRIA